MLAPDVVAEVIRADNRIEPDDRGNPRYRGEIGRATFTVVVALDNPNLVITIIRR